MLLGRDASKAGQTSVLGVPLLVSPAVAGGVVWGLDSSRVFTVLRDDVSLDVDKSAFWTSDRVGIKGSLRVGFAFVHPASVIKIAASA